MACKGRELDLWPIDKWDPAKHTYAWDQNDHFKYRRLCIDLHTLLLTRDYHPTRNPHAYVRASDLYRTLMRIALTREPTQDKDLFVTHVYVPPTRLGDLPKYKECVDRRVHRRAVLAPNGAVAYVDAPYKVRTKEEHDLLQSIVRNLEQAHTHTLYRYLLKYAPDLLSTGPYK